MNKPRITKPVPVTVPCTGNNAKITGFALHHTDMGIKPMNEDRSMYGIGRSI
ncbi:hypothetical protein NXW13_00775 [Bacteroides thetaiotaomicron]|nr:hypothetical protein [Bacteroides thetaiotaomicron]